VLCDLILNNIPITLLFVCLFVDLVFLRGAMSSSTVYKQWKFAIIDDDATKIDKLRSSIQSTIHCFPNVSLFNGYLQTTTDARECLVLTISSRLISDLPQDIEQNLYRLFVYGEKDEHDMPSFNEVCLLLSDLLIAQRTEQWIYSHHSNERALAQALAQELIFRHEDAAKQLEDLCAAIDDQIPFGEQETD